MFCVCVLVEPSESGSVIMLVVVPLLVLLLLSIAVCIFVLWLRSKRQHDHLQEHDPPMLKLPSGADPTYGVIAAHELMHNIYFTYINLILLYKYKIELLMMFCSTTW